MLIRRPLLGRKRSAPGGGPHYDLCGPRDTGRLGALAASRPEEHVHVGAVLSSPALLRGGRVFIVRDRGEVVAVAARYRGLAVAVDPGRRDDPELLSTLAAALARLTASEDVLFGPAEVIRPLLDRCAAHGLAALEVRDQVLMAARGLPPAGREPLGWRLRRARRRDHRWLLETHAAMCREDLGVDQVSWNLPGYARYFHGLIRAGASFVGEIEGRPVFKAETPVESGAARLVEGVFTLPSHRRLGCAGAAMRELARRAARDGKRLCLYVQRENERAQRVYRAAGFRTCGPWLTAVLSRRRRGRFTAPAGTPAATGRSPW